MIAAAVICLVTEARRKRVRESIDEADGVRDEELPLIAKPDLAHERIECDEQRVGGDGIFIRHTVEQRRLAGIGVADECHGRDRPFLPPFA